MRAGVVVLASGTVSGTAPCSSVEPGEEDGGLVRAASTASQLATARTATSAATGPARHRRAADPGGGRWVEILLDTAVRVDHHAVLPPVALVDDQRPHRAVVAAHPVQAAPDRVEPRRHLHRAPVDAGAVAGDPDGGGHDRHTRLPAGRFDQLFFTRRDP